MCIYIFTHIYAYIHIYVSTLLYSRISIHYPVVLSSGDGLLRVGVRPLRKPFAAAHPIGDRPEAFGIMRENKDILSI